MQISPSSWYMKNKVDIAPWIACSVNKLVVDCSILLWYSLGLRNVTTVCLSMSEWTLNLIKYPLRKTCAEYLLGYCCIFSIDQKSSNSFKLSRWIKPVLSDIIQEGERVMSDILVVHEQFTEGKESKMEGINGRESKWETGITMDDEKSWGWLAWEKLSDIHREEEDEY